jgi:DNA-binding response OmpR family regulator
MQGTQAGASILLLEDDIVLLETLSNELTEAGYRVSATRHGESALEMTAQQRFDLYLFDINVPYISGLELLGQLRESGDDTPSIFLTSRQEETDRIAGFENGCDDYLVKPFSMAELKMRISTLLRRVNGPEALVVDDLYIDRQQQRVRIDGRDIELDPHALAILHLFASQPNRIITIEEIIEKLYRDSEPSHTVIRVHISKINALFESRRIVNIRGVGYRYETV